MNKIIIFNGPPRSGKDLSARLLTELYTEHKVKHIKFADAIKEGVHALLQTTFRDSAAYENNKDAPHWDFFHQRPRTCYIAASENFMKPLFGKEIFGELFVRRVNGRVFSDDVIVVSDCGFAYELLPVLRHFNHGINILFVRLYRDGCTFEGDSRNYVFPEAPPLADDLYTQGVKVVEVSNNGTPADLKLQLQRIVNSLWPSL